VRTRIKRERESGEKKKRTDTRWFGGDDGMILGLSVKDELIAGVNPRCAPSRLSNFARPELPKRFVRMRSECQLVEFVPTLWGEG
jgi:hypothetical protein